MARPTQTYEVAYIRKNSWPYSIDEGVKGERETIQVKKSETFVKHGKRYYRMRCGIGTYVDLFVENVQ